MVRRSTLHKPRFIDDVAAKKLPLAEQIEQLRAASQTMLRDGDGNQAIATLLEIIAGLSRTNEAMARALYGRRSERLTPEELGQLALAFGATPQAAAAAEPDVPTPDMPEQADDADRPAETDRKQRKRKHPGRARLDPALPRRITCHDVPVCERDCIHCGSRMQPIGHIDHERVDYIPARLEVVVDRREKVACLACRQDIATAPRPASRDSMRQDDASLDAVAAEVETATRAIAPTAAGQGAASTAPGAHVMRRVGASLLAHLLEAKCDDALPIYRQRQMLSRLGFDVPLNTLYGYWDAAARLVQPVAQVVLSVVLGEAIVGLDDTKLDWLDPDKGSRRQRGHLWCFMGTSRLVAFDFTKTWCAEEVAPWVCGIDGFIQCDDYKGYSAKVCIGDSPPTPLVPPDRRLGCWMHLRRPFHKAFKAGEKHAIIGLGHIKELYAIEALAKEQAMSPDERLTLRQQRSQPIADAFFAWVDEQNKLARPRSYLGQALGYATQQKDFVLRCLSDGRFELDTGRVERQIREPVIGRKNYLFSGSAKAAQRLAGVYTLVCSCQNLGIDTRAYLTEIITQLQAGFPLRHINRLRPDIWAEGRRRRRAEAQQLTKQPREQAACLAG